MVVPSVQEFLESSTIHGLLHISTAKSKTTRALWVAIVVACFVCAAWMITDSYKDWQESPVSTTITTHPIKDLQFPAVTVCPPREIKTIINHLFRKVKDANFTDNERKHLKGISKKVFIEIPNEKHATHMTNLLNDETIRSIAYGEAKMPELDDQGLITMTSSELEGSFQTPGFGDQDYQGDFYKKPESLHFVLDLPENTNKMVGVGALVISVQSEENWSYSLQEEVLKVYDTNLNFSSANEFCEKLGGNMAFIKSQEEQNEIFKLAIDQFQWRIWLGGRKGVDNMWYWLDGEVFSYQQWKLGPNDWYGLDGYDWNGISYDGDCLFSDCMYEAQGKWESRPCDHTYSVACAKNRKMMQGNHTFALKNVHLKKKPMLHFWWNNAAVNQTRQSRGLQITWKIENGTLPDFSEYVSRSLSGNVSTPWFGKMPMSHHSKGKHEYSAVLELSNNISDALNNDNLSVEVDVASSDYPVHLLATDLHYEYFNISMNWIDAEALCVSKGGHLASVSTPSDWALNSLENFIKREESNIPKDCGQMSLWLGGTDHDLEGEWTWTDRSKWATNHWAQREPSNVTGKEDFLMLRNLKENGNKKLIWYAKDQNKIAHPLCQLPTQKKITEKTELTFPSPHSYPLQFTWNAQFDTENLGNNSLIGGFKLNWHLGRSTHKNLAAEGDKVISWRKRKSDQCLKRACKNMRVIMNLLREGKKRKVSKEDILGSVLKHRWSPEILNSGSYCLSEEREYQVIANTAYDFKLTIWHDSWIPDEDLRFGAKLYSFIHYCPKHLGESAKLSRFFEYLLHDHSLDTVLAATMNSIQPRAGGTIMDFESINMWYDELEQKYNLSLAPIVVASSTTDQLKHLKALDPPFLKDMNASYIDDYSEDEYDELLQFSGIQK